jgi:Asp-tRNA(Asn)/Glu-tRNA(Gln) amidotransferase C subunit
MARCAVDVMDGRCLQMQEQPSPITEEVVAQVAKLANLELAPERIVALTPQIQFFVGLFALLDQLDLREQEPVVVFNAEWR